MALKCPNCQSPDVRSRNLAKCVGGTIGSLAGATGGAAGVIDAARMGFSASASLGPYAAVIGSVSAATLRGIVGATIGCEVGSALGELIDQHVLENDACQSCGHTFRSTPRRSLLPPLPSGWHFPGRSHQREAESRYDDEDNDPDDDDDRDHNGRSFYARPI